MGHCPVLGEGVREIESGAGGRGGGMVRNEEIKQTISERILIENLRNLNVTLVFPCVSCLSFLSFLPCLSFLCFLSFFLVFLSCLSFLYFFLVFLS